MTYLVNVITCQLYYYPQEIRNYLRIDEFKITLTQCVPETRTQSVWVHGSPTIEMWCRATPSQPDASCGAQRRASTRDHDLVQKTNYSSF